MRTYGFIYGWNENCINICAIIRRQICQTSKRVKICTESVYFPKLPTVEETPKIFFAFVYILRQAYMSHFKCRVHFNVWKQDAGLSAVLPYF